MNTKIIIACIAVLLIALLFLRKKKHHAANRSELMEIQNFLVLSHNQVKNKDNYAERIGVPIYYINLDRSPERKEHVETQMKRYGLGATRISGIDGSKLDLRSGNVTFDDKTVSYINNFPCSKAELGCLLSHLKAINTAYNNGNELALILEDDISLSLLPYWPTTLMKVMEEAPKDWHVISLFSQWCMNEKESFIPFSLRNPCYGAVAYIINRQGMYNCLHEIINNGSFIFDKSRPDAENDLMADVTVYHRAKNSYWYTRHVLMFAYNDKDLMDSTIHTGHTDDHIARSVQSISRYLIRSDGSIKIRSCWPSNTPIPHKIHQVWIGFNGNQIPEKYKVWNNECMDLHQGWDYKLWKDDENRQFLAKNYPWFLETFDNYDKPIKRIDAMRYFILFHYGGVYMDGDFICLKNLENLLQDGCAIFGYQYRDHNPPDAVCNAFMAAPPKHPLLENIIYALKDNANKGVIQATGPEFLTNQIKKYNGVDVIVYPMPLIYTHQWNEKDKMTKQCLNNTDHCRVLFPGSYTTTDWAGSWK